MRKPSARIRYFHLAASLGFLTLLALPFQNCSQARFAMTDEAIMQSLNASGGMIINRGDLYTNDKLVTLIITNRDTDQMYITNEPDCSRGQWEPYNPIRSWTLAEENTNTRVYIKFRKAERPEVESSCFSDDITHDNQPPVVTVSTMPPALTNAASIQAGFTATDAVSGIESFLCRRPTDSFFSSCSTALSLSNLAEGPGSVEAKAVDRAGNMSAPVNVSWFVDRTPPTVAFNTTPAVLSNQTAAGFTFSGSDNHSANLQYECSLDSAAFAACASPKSFNVAAGAHSLKVRARDEAGNASGVISHSWTIDLSVPSVEITSQPAPFVRDTNASIGFTGSDDGQPLARFECKIDQGAYATCASPRALSGLSEGRHEFSVRGYDNVGNVSAPATASWLVDTTPPAVTITTRPASPTNQTGANFGYSATDSGSGIARIECRLDGAAFADCSSGQKSYTNLGAGSHTFEARALDKAGNTSTVASHTWSIDLTPPRLNIISGPAALTNEKSAVLVMEVFGDSGESVSAECKLDLEANYVPCTLTKAYQNLAEGGHVFTARAKDAAGNVSEAKVHSWTVDATGPAIRFVSVTPSTIDTFTTARIKFEVTDEYSTVQSVQCGLAGSLTTCPQTHEASFPQQPTGAYTYTVKAVDALGNESENSYSWTVIDNTRAVTSTVTVNETRKADVLVVIDNSGSMNTEQTNMGNRFNNFIDKLSSLDWRLAITTTTIAPQNSWGTAPPGADGLFLPFKNMPSNTYVLNSSMSRATAQTAFASTITRPASEGSGYEQGIKATYRALERSRDPSVSANAPNVGFFRDDAVLAVLVVSDADETPQGNTEARNLPQNLFNHVKTLWPNKPFQFHSIVVKSGDSACLRLAGSGNEGYGVSYEALSTMTGGVIGSVCADDYSSQLAAMGNGVVDLVNSVSLSCAPLDLDKDGKPDITVTLQNGGTVPSFTVDQLKLTFSQALPVGSHSIQYRCLGQ
ncbi:MAG: hypothetical protein KF865_13475 [Bdellovibrionaceae bacterium]|nr:hypothetical protein [Pseudobdellovibrionaceae bacterium]